MLDFMADFLVSLFTFRSPEHFQWFVVSMACLALITTLTVIARRRRNQNRAFLIPTYMIGYHGLVSLLAALNLGFHFAPERTVSSDCVWFNALMAGIYFGLRRWSARPIQAKKRPEAKLKDARPKRKKSISPGGEP